MKNIIIDEEFQRLLPPLNEEQFCSLEESILEYGCMNPLVLWNDILIDGFHRYRIVTEHGLPFNTINMKFNSRDEVIVFMIKIQIDRRNLTPMQLTYYRGLHYNLEKKMHGDIERTSINPASGQNDHLQGSTANRLSEQYRISPRTIRRDGEIADVIIAIGKKSPDTKTDILSGATRISRKQLREMSTDMEEDVTEIVTQIRDGSFESTKTGRIKQDGTDNAADMQPWEKQFGSMTDEFRNILRTHAKNDDTASVKTALRQYISMLEDLYRSI